MIHLLSWHESLDYILYTALCTKHLNIFPSILTHLSKQLSYHSTINIMKEEKPFFRMKDMTRTLLISCSKKTSQVQTRQSKQSTFTYESMLLVDTLYLSQWSILYRWIRMYAFDGTTRSQVILDVDVVVLVNLMTFNSLRN